MRGPRQRSGEIDRLGRNQGRDVLADRDKLHNGGWQHSGGQEPADDAIVVIRGRSRDRAGQAAIARGAGAVRMHVVVVMRVPCVSAARRVTMLHRMRMPQPGSRAGQQPDGDQRAARHTMECP